MIAQQKTKEKAPYGKESQPSKREKNGTMKRLGMTAARSKQHGNGIPANTTQICAKAVCNIKSAGKLKVFE